VALLHAIVLFWVHDPMPDAAGTERVIERTAPLVVRALTISRLPEMRNMLDDIISLIEEVRQVSPSASRSPAPSRWDAFVFSRRWEPLRGKSIKETAMVGFILGLIIVGLIAGALARLLVPGRDPMGLLATIVLGIVGSFVGGFLADVLFRDDAEDLGLHPVGIIGSVIGAIIVLLIYNAVQRRRGVNV
jgi:uncharacterized membrane protein YeaQ/YmgE (transglycosylase-associated protein family)